MPNNTFIQLASIKLANNDTLLILRDPLFPSDHYIGTDAGQYNDIALSLSNALHLAGNIAAGNEAHYITSVNQQLATNGAIKC